MKSTILARLLSESSHGIISTLVQTCTRKNIAIMLALSMQLVSTWLLNVTAYPGFNDFFPIARDIATTFGGFTALCFAFLAQYRPRIFLHKQMMPATMVFLIIATCGMLVAEPLHSPACAVVCSCLRSLAFTTGATYLCFTLVSLAVQDQLIVLVGAVFMRYVWVVLLWATPLIVQKTCFVIVTLIAYVLLWRYAAPYCSSLIQAETPADLSVTNPLSFLPFTNKMFVTILLFGTALGFSITFQSQASYPQPTVYAFIIFTILFLIAILKRSMRVDSLFGIAYALVLAGFLLIPGALAEFELPELLCNTFFEAGSIMFTLITWYMVALLGKQNLIGALPLIMMVNTALNLGTEVGALSGHAFNYLSTFGNLAGILDIVIAGIAFVYAIYNFLLTQSFSFDELAHNMRSVTVLPTPTENPAHSRDITEICRQIAAESRLTDREYDVLRLLARGRNVSYIQEKLVLSRNTIKSHVANLYNKLDVHSHQELIDLVEQRPNSCDTESRDISKTQHTQDSKQTKRTTDTSSGERDSEVRPRSTSTSKSRVPAEPEATMPSQESVCEDVCKDLARQHGLTPREEEVFGLLLRNCNAKAIEDTLGISYNTAKVHMANIYKKLGIHSRQDLTQLLQTPPES